jgi:hypothetical protein
MLCHASCCPTACCDIMPHCNETRYASDCATLKLVVFGVAHCACSMNTPVLWCAQPSSIKLFEWSIVSLPGAAACSAVNDTNG